MNEPGATSEVRGIHRAFEEWARRTPQSIALMHLGTGYSYAEVDARANALANHLRTLGVRRGEVVAIAMVRSVEMIVSMLAILKCGGAYLPLDNANPDARTRLLLETAEVRCVVVDPANDRPIFRPLRRVSSEDRALFESHLKEWSGVDSTPDDRAYVMFTSGSTGKPKGVVVPHRGILRLVRNTNYIRIERSDRILQFAPPSFDASTFEVWGALLNGASLVLYSGAVADPNLLRGEIAGNGVTILWLTAGLFHLIADRLIDAFAPLKILLAGGDILNPKCVNKVLERFPAITLINGYGPTENTTFTCCHVMTVANKPSRTVPIGKAITGTVLRIVDESMNPMSPGDIGELIVGGQGVALGYLGGDAAGSPFFSHASLGTGLSYRTGDLVRENASGEIEFIGRTDNQVKIRGYRVSLEEVRERIMELDNVREATVSLSGLESGGKELVAYVQRGDGVASLDVRELRRKLGSVLPAYMIPDRFVCDADLTLTTNGKVSRRA